VRLTPLLVTLLPLLISIGRWHHFTALSNMIRTLAFALVAGAAAARKTHTNPWPPTTTTADTKACRTAAELAYPYCDTKLSLDARLTDLIGRLTAAEKPPLLTAREGGGDSPGPPGNVSSIGLPEYDWGLNCIHGVQSTCGEKDGEQACATSFPNPNALGATWNQSLWKGMGAVIGNEARSLWLQGAREQSSWSGEPHIGLDCWSPNVRMMLSCSWCCS